MRYQLFILCILTGCSTATLSPYQTAERLAASNTLTQNIIQTKKFRILTYSRNENPTKPLHVYIEGDGHAWQTRTKPSLDPTPHYPVALELASQDTHPNILYIGRPCQYLEHTKDTHCQISDWTSHRFAPIVIDTTNEIINHYAKGRPIQLIGYSGGASVSVLLAAKRNDVLGVRTVAGNLDVAILDNYHQTTPLRGLNPSSVAQKIAKIPQYHFFGQKDKTIPPKVAQDMLRRYASACLHTQFLEDVTHHQGWQEIWPDLLLKPLDCE